MKKHVILIALISLVAFASCKKDRFPIDEPVVPQTMEDLKVPSEFNWKTTKDISLTLTTPVRGIVEVTNEKGIAYQKAYLQPATPYTMKLTVPVYEQTVLLKFSNEVIPLQLTSHTLTYQFNK